MDAGVRRLVLCSRSGRISATAPGELPRRRGANRGGGGEWRSKRGLRGVPWGRDFLRIPTTLLGLLERKAKQVDETMY